MVCGSAGTRRDGPGRGCHPWSPKLSGTTGKASITPTRHFVGAGSLVQDRLATLLVGTILLAAFSIFAHRGASAFVADAVDRLLQTRACMRCDFRGANLAGKDLHGVNLTGARLIGANLEGANLSGADLSGAWLTKAKLRNATLDHADLRGAYLAQADLTNASLRGSNLGKARLSHAVLKGADMKQAVLKGAMLHGAKIDGAGGLTSAQLAEACGDADTALPRKLSVAACTVNSN